MSYDITTNVGKVRLLIGDTNEANEVFTDAEITYFLTANSGDLLLAAADALQAWVAKYATAPDSEKIGDYSYSQKIVAHLNKLAAEYAAKAISSPYLTWAEMDLTIGSGITAEED